MGMDPTASLRISIWQAFSPPSSLLYTDAERSHLLHPRGSSLLKEIYSWQTREEVFGSISDDTLRTSLKALLVDVFNETVPPSERTCTKLNDFLAAAGSAIHSGQTEWMSSAESDDDRDDTATTIDPFRALFQHLQWIHEIFKDRPGTSILVR